MFFLVWDFGGCNGGDHCNGIEEFKTKEQAATKKKQLQERDPFSAEDGCFLLIEGLVIDVP